MRKTLGLTFAVAMVAATVGLAQTAGTSGTQTGTTGAQTKGKPITVSGCVQKASESGTTGTSGSAMGGAATKFELTNATIAGGGSGSAMGSASGTGTGTGSTGSATGSATGSTTGSASSASGTSGSGAGKTYRLEATDSQLAAHVGHKVEITGSIDEASASASASATTSETAGTSGSARATAPRLKVESVKMVAATCP
jgi:hypothetical protein